MQKRHIHVHIKIYFLNNPVAKGQGQSLPYRKRSLSQVICGVNAVTEILKQHRGIQGIFIAKGRTSQRIREILDLAREKQIPIAFKDRIYLDRLSSCTAHQGILAIIGTYGYCTAEDLIVTALAQKTQVLLLAADHITDPGNLGSLIRTAEFFGVHGLILPKDRSASITDTVHKRSAGGTAYLAVARVVNLARTLKQLADKGLWLVGAEGKSETSLYNFDWSRNLVLVLGSERRGLSNVVRNLCHHLVSIPQLGHIDSLNVSVAAGIILSEIVRQRGNYK
jgi:23S rRNA (guanosine2251-2'-O)-methyltransferase